MKKTKVMPTNIKEILTHANCESISLLTTNENNMNVNETATAPRRRSIVIEINGKWSGIAPLQLNYCDWVFLNLQNFKLADFHMTCFETTKMQQNGTIRGANNNQQILLCFVFFLLLCFRISPTPSFACIQNGRKMCSKME